MNAARRIVAGGPSASGIAYTVDGQGCVLSVQEVTLSDTTTTRADAPPPVALRTLVTPLTWEPVHRLLAWDAGGDDRGRTAR